MGYPISYDPTPLSPIIVIKDLDGVEQFRYESAAVVDGEPVQEFKLVGGSLIGGINTDAGQFFFTIRDDDLDLIDRDNPMFPSKIKQGWEVEVFFGKDSTNVNLWFTCIVNLVQTHTQTNTTTIGITCFGYLSLTAFRYSSMKRTQERLADGTTLDPDDDSTKNTELYKDVFTDEDHLAVPGLGLLDITIGDVEDLPTKVGDYRKNFVTLGSEANELAQMTGAYWGIGPDKKAFLHQRGSTSSSFLITNDVDNPSLQTTNWNPDRLAFMESQDLVRKDSTQDTGVTIVHGIGSQRKDIDHDEQNSNAILDLSVKNYAFPFLPQKNNIFQISLYLVKAVSALTNGLSISIIGADGSGDPDTNDVRETKLLSDVLLNIELDAAQTSLERFIDIKFEKIAVTKDEKLFVLIELSANGMFDLTAEYQTGSGEYFTSSDLSTWTPFVGEPKFISYASKTVRIVGQNTTTQKFLRPKETVVTLPDQPNEDTVLQIFESILETQSKIVVNYDPIIISPPTLPLELGKTLRFQDVNSGFEREFNLVGYSLNFNAYTKENKGASELKISLQEIYI